MEKNRKSIKQTLKPDIKQQKVDREPLELFKKEFERFVSVVEQQEQKEREEHHKLLCRDFFKDTFYKRKYVNTSGTIDLVIHNENNPTSPIAVLIEYKAPKYKHDMVTVSELNKKSMQELVLYFLRERKTVGNIHLRNLIITNNYEWFIFDAQEFDKYFYKNAKLISDFVEFENRTTSGTQTKDFYNDIASPEIEKIKNEITFTYFNINDYKGKPDEEIVALYKFLSPRNLLKQPLAEIGGNTLNLKFYSELLWILGLEEIEKNNKRIISRQQKRNEGSIIENIINRISAKNLWVNLDLKQFGEKEEDAQFEVALQLAITWINRLLFTKLLEAQIIKFRKDKSLAFLTAKEITCFSDLDVLFFEALAVKEEKRTGFTQEQYKYVPYLNSSLFEKTALEQQTISIDALNNSINMPIYSNSVLREKQKSAPLAYLLNFLDAYDFANDTDEEIREQEKSIIKSSVLGLIFEKINGYKDGSVFTPTLITMYMCREVISKAVVQKFNEINNLSCNDLDDLANAIGTNREDIEKANATFNSIRICDPAVGSGHFLVSALNELIFIKSKLGILADKDYKRLKYNVIIENDELVITDEDGDLFSYHPKNTESQRIQETLFNEKQTLIENCLFGVDINSNSVKICQLRLWIELLKNAYYQTGTDELQTLPNIDINIKCGNSLLNRFPLRDTTMSGSLGTKRQYINQYQKQVSLYKTISDRAARAQTTREIERLKNVLYAVADTNDKDYKAFVKAKEELFEHTQAAKTFIEFQTENWKTKTAELTDKVITLEKRYNDKLKANFEWRFEFPEVLDDNGTFAGFDLIIGNPPYLKEGKEGKEVFKPYKNDPFYEGKMDLWYMFVCKRIELLKPNGFLSFIATNNWVSNAGASKLRKFVIDNTKINQLIDFGSFMVFDSANIQTMIMQFQNDTATDNYTFDYRKLESKATSEDVESMLNDKQNNRVTKFQPTISKEKYKEGYLKFWEENRQPVFEQILGMEKSIVERTFFEEDEIAQGIVPNPDVVNNRNLSKIPREKRIKYNINVGDGVFVIDDNKFLNLPENERKYIKPLIEAKNLDRYIVNKTNQRILYITKQNYAEDAPTLISHLDKYREIMEDRRENRNGRLNYYNLHWERESSLFEKGEKIFAVRKCPDLPIFSYTKNEAYVMMAVNIIKTSRFNLKYLTGLLNSKLIAYWLKYNGKMQGDNYQLDKEPLMQIPIYQPTKKQSKQIADIVDKILAKKAIEIDAEQQQIDILVYKMYGLTLQQVNSIKELGNNEIIEKTWNKYNLDYYGSKNVY